MTVRMFLHLKSGRVFAIGTEPGPCRRCRFQKRDSMKKETTAQIAVRHLETRKENPCRSAFAVFRFCAVLSTSSFQIAVNE